MGKRQRIQWAKGRTIVHKNTTQKLKI
jgi:hypothetical protein